MLVFVHRHVKNPATKQTTPNKIPSSVPIISPLCLSVFVNAFQVYQPLANALQLSKHLVDPLEQSLIVALKSLDTFGQQCPVVGLSGLQHLKIALGIRTPLSEVVPLVIPLSVTTPDVEGIAS